MDPEFELVGEMGLLIKREVAAGFPSREEIIRHAVQAHANGGPRKELLALAEELIASILYRHLKDQRGWPLVTDCDRLDIAFAQLEEKGILARHDLKDDGAEGFMEGIDEATDAGHHPHGYVYYQRRDIEVAIEGLGLYLDYGAVDDDAEEEEDASAALRVGHEVAEALRRQGLKVQWDGGLSRRIHVKLDWKRRRNWSDDA